MGKLTHRNIHTLRRSIGVVFQDYKLLPNKTVFENVSFAQEVIAKDRKTIKFNTWKALKNVGLTAKKDVYPAYLSGGEQQRIAIARALLASPSILILDDSTSAVDYETEERIQEALSVWMAKRTTFIVAQRISSVLKADQIYLLDAGRIAASGTHNELLTTSPLYQEIYASQLGSVEDKA